MSNFKKKKVFLIKDILKVLPHRYPFILIDKVKIKNLGNDLIAKKYYYKRTMFSGSFPLISQFYQSSNY